jgi:hypothetical protein
MSFEPRDTSFCLSGSASLRAKYGRPERPGSAIWLNVSDPKKRPRRRPGLFLCLGLVRECLLHLTGSYAGWKIPTLSM